MKRAQLQISRKKLHYNYTYFRERLAPGTKILVMVKANAYGLGDVQVSTLVQEFGADYLGVATPVEGIHLQRSGVFLPIIVFTPGVGTFGELINYGLQPNIINLTSLKEMGEAVRTKKGIYSYPIHIELDTGMRRVGFDESEMEQIAELLKEYPALRVVSLFSHLAAADDPKHDQFTLAQIDKLLKLTEKFDQLVGYRPINHILNSPGSERFDTSTTNMVRLGIGLYGTSCVDNNLLKIPVTFAAPIVHLQKLTSGTVGYGRAGVIEEGKETVVATVAAGYGDGLYRFYGGGKVHCLLNGKRVPTIGNISMDVFSIDVTGVDCKIGDEVIVYGDSTTPLELAELLRTIPYEILTSVSHRVERVIVD